MKTVIRKGVFETNSSSTHSLSLKRNARDVNEKDASFVIQSPLAKAVTLLGLIDNGEHEFNRKYGSRANYDDEYPKIKEEVLSKIKELNPSLLENIDLEEISGEEIAEILLKLDDLDNFYKEEDFDDICDYFDKISDLEYYFTDDLNQKILLTKAKQFIFEEYAKIVNKPYDEAKEEIDFEAFAYIELKDALNDKEHAKENVEKLMNRDYRLRKAYDESENKDIISFAKKYLYENYLEFKNQPGRKYCCHRYFCDGALNDCYCGLESYDDICSALEIDVNDDDSKVREAIKIYLSDECKLVAKEKYGASMQYFSEVEY
jgi:hypothetical protein